MEQTIQEQLQDWANKYVQEFNELAQRYNTTYYTQSPLSMIKDQVDLMVVGINPKGNLGNEEKSLTPTQFLNGNPFWKERFKSDGTMHPDWLKKSKFLPGAHFFLGYDNLQHSESIDNDEKTIWTNLSPFDSGQGSRDLPKELMTIGIKSTLDLINIVHPKRIVILGTNAFDQLVKKAPEEMKTQIEYRKVFPNIPYYIGRICRIPSVNVCHPSGMWQISNKFTSVFILLHKLTELSENGKLIRTLDESVNIIRSEVKLYQQRIQID